MANPFFPRRVAHGYLLVSWAAGLFVEPAPGPVLANYRLEDLRFITPVTYDDAIRVTLTAKKITPRVTDEYGEVVWDARLTNQKDEIVATYDVLTLVAKTWPPPKAWPLTEPGAASAGGHCPSSNDGPHLRRVERPGNYARKPENTIFTTVSASWSTVPERPG